MREVKINMQTKMQLLIVFKLENHAFSLKQSNVKIKK